MSFPDLDAASLAGQISYAEKIRIAIARKTAAGWYDHFAGEKPRAKRDWRKVLGSGLFPCMPGTQLELAL